MLNDFNQRPLRHNYDTKEWNFCAHKYVDQLIRDGHELYPSAKSKSKMLKILRSEGIVAGRLG